MYQLAQINIGRMLGPIDSSLMASFVALLAEVNALADSSPGFVWRLQSSTGNATTLRPFKDEMILVNMSTWESVEALSGFVYRSAHTDVLKRRREWFEKFEGAYTALWWVPMGHQPTVKEGKERLNRLIADGPTAFAFTFREPYPAPLEAQRENTHGGNDN